MIEISTVFPFFTRESKLTYLLEDEIGGNCKTRVLVCLKPHSERAILGPILHTAKHFSNVKNYPVLNDPLAQVRFINFLCKLFLPMSKSLTGI